MIKRNRAKFRVSGVSFEQAIVGFLSKYPGSTGEEINSFVQHPEFKNFSTILSAMKAGDHLTRTDDRPAKWSVGKKTTIKIPEMDFTKAGSPPRVLASTTPTTSTQTDETILEAAVHQVQSTQQAAVSAMERFNSLLPNLDEASRHRIFQAMSGTIPPTPTKSVVVEEKREETPPEEDRKVVTQEKKESTPRPQKPRLSRRSPNEIQKVVDNITILLKKNPEGLRSEQLQEELGMEAKELPKPLAEGLAQKHFKRRGDRRQTTYYLPPHKIAAKELASN